MPNCLPDIDAVGCGLCFPPERPRLEPGSRALKNSEPDPEPSFGPTSGRVRVRLKSPGLGWGSGSESDRHITSTGSHQEPNDDPSKDPTSSSLLPCSYLRRCAAGKGYISRAMPARALNASCDRDGEPLNPLPQPIARHAVSPVPAAPVAIEPSSYLYPPSCCSTPGPPQLSRHQGGLASSECKTRVFLEKIEFTIEFLASKYVRITSSEVFSTRKWVRPKFSLVGTNVAATRDSEAPSRLREVDLSRVELSHTVTSSDSGVEPSRLGSTSSDFKSVSKVN
ncbi:hypothetical protein B0H14DRAFT_2599673 [Mycena olivaceomarginata]|nr:hypothetical protein B0H14DRAFT_2599673 [Mycena olivaceomarginata]